MQKSTIGTILIIASMVCGVWFMLTSWVWAYLANVFISFPVGILGVVFWVIAKKLNPQNKWNRLAIILHLIGLASAVIVLLSWWIFEGV
jgi:hypothetical protein